MSGTAIAQTISLISIPILTRLFTPDEFGVFAVYFGISSLLASISGGRYELAIMLPKKDLNSYQILIISFWLVILTSILSLIFLFIFFKPIATLLEIQSYKYFIFLIPITVFLLGTYNILSQWLSRFKKFKDIAISNVSKNSTAVSSKIAAGLISLNVFGLVIGEIIGQFFSILVLFLRNKKNASLKKYKINKQILKQEMKENRNFPFFSMPMAFLNSISVNILIYILTIIFNTTIVGLYTQANKVINYPLNFITSSFASVFYQKITKTGRKSKLYLYSYLFSFFTALVILLPVVFWGEELFSFVLGEKWAFSGNIAKLIIPIAVFGFATRNVSSVFSLLKKQEITLIWQIIFLTFALLIFYNFKTESLEKILLYFSIFGSIMYFILAIIGYMLLQKDKNII